MEIKLKRYFECSGKIIGMHFIFAIATFLFSKTFYWFLSPDGDLIPWRLVVYSTISGYLYLSAIYSMVWDEGKKDNIPESKPHLSNGLVIGLLSSIPAVILFVIAVFAQGIIDTIYKFYQFSFWGFIALGEGNALSCGLVILPPIVVCTFAYILGYKKINISQRYISKLFFKKQSND